MARVGWSIDLVDGGLQKYKQTTRVMSVAITVIRVQEKSRNP